LDKTKIKFLPFIMAAMWLVARVIAGKFMGIENAKNFGVLSNVLLILILIFPFGVFQIQKLHGRKAFTFLSDLKDSMKAALKYVLAAVAAIAFYYGVLSNDVQTIREARINSFTTEMQSDENLAKLKSEHPELKDQTREQLIATNTANVERYVSVQMQVLGGLLALTFVSFMYSLLAVFFWRSVVKRM
jgi:hypothetical protein